MKKQMELTENSIKLKLNCRNPFLCSRIFCWVLLQFANYEWMLLIHTLIQTQSTALATFISPLSLLFCMSFCVFFNSVRVPIFVFISFKPFDSRSLYICGTPTFWSSSDARATRWYLRRRNNHNNNNHYRRQPGYWPFGLVWCNIYVTCDVLACSSSILHMCFISLGRYMGIRNPLGSRQTSTKRRTTIKIATVWAMAMLVSSSITVLGMLICE